MCIKAHSISSKISQKNQEILPYDRAKDMLDYNPDTGVLTWKARTLGHRVNQINSLVAGKIAGTLHKSSGYLTFCVDHNTYQVHRVAFLLYNGQWPRFEVDHISHDRTDNRWANLREATYADNLKNQTMYSNNRSGHMGIAWDKDGDRWRAYINVNKKRINIGSFADKNDAINARMIAEIKYGFHENHGAEK